MIVFLSYGGLLQSLMNGEDTFGMKVNRNVMNSKRTFFALGCSRKHVMRDVHKVPGELIKHNNDRAYNIHNNIVEAVLKAEREDRVCWVNGHNDHELFSAFLRKHNIFFESKIKNWSCYDLHMDLEDCNVHGSF